MIAGCGRGHGRGDARASARVAPAGGHFRDSDRASGVFGVRRRRLRNPARVRRPALLRAATPTRRTKAEDEATAVFEQYEVAALFQPPAKRNALWGQLVCYARAVDRATSGRRWSTAAAASSSTRGLERMEARGAARRRSRTDERGDGVSASGSRSRRSGTTRGGSGCSRRRADAARALLWVMLDASPPSRVVASCCSTRTRPSGRSGRRCSSAASRRWSSASLLAVALLAAPFQGGHGSVEPNGHALHAAR